MALQHRKGRHSLSEDRQHKHKRQAVAGQLPYRWPATALRCRSLTFHSPLYTAFSLTFSLPFTAFSLTFP